MPPYGMALGVGGLMRSFFSSIRYLFTRQDLARFVVLVTLMVGGSLLELASLGAVPLFVSILAAAIASGDAPVPEMANRLVAWLHMEDTSRLTLWASLILAAVFAVRTLYQLLSLYLQERLLANRQVALATRLCRAYMSAPYLFRLRRNSTELINTANYESERLITQLLSPFLSLLRNSAVLVAIAVLLTSYDPSVALATLAVLAVFAGGAMGLMNRRLRQLGVIAHIHRQKALKSLTEGLAVCKEAQILGRRDFFARGYRLAVERLCHDLCWINTFQRSLWPTMELITLAVLLGALCLMILMGRPMKVIVPTLALITACLARLKGCLTVMMLSASSIH